jgi:hypothetical protein
MTSTANTTLTDLTESTAYDYCEKCSETIDYFLSKSFNWTRKCKTAAVKKKKYKDGYRKYMKKFKDLDFEFEELKANHEALNESHEQCLNKLNSLKQDDFSNRQAEIAFNRLSLENQKLKQNLELETGRELDKISEVNLIDFDYETTSILLRQKEKVNNEVEALNSK